MALVGTPLTGVVIAGIDGAPSGLIWGIPAILLATQIWNVIRVGARDADPSQGVRICWAMPADVVVMILVAYTCVTAERTGVAVGAPVLLPSLMVGMFRRDDPTERHDSPDDLPSRRVSSE